MQNITTDFLVVGGGVAGLRAAIELAGHGRVVVVTKDIPTECSTEYAQGGVAVALSDEDEVGIHFEDTIKAGDGLCREEAVRVLVEEGPRRIAELIDWGAEFDKDGGRLSFTMEAAHSRRRILHARGDSTGRELERVLISKVRTFPYVERLPFSTAVDLLLDEGGCAGAVVLENDRTVEIAAKATILATGGAGQIFSRTTNPAVATGDGVAIAYRAGAVLEDMEFFQFHPTALFASSAPQFLLSEAMRGEGAVLRNIRREPFMKRYHADAELAPRDVVSRAIVSEMVETQSRNVYLDLTHRDAEFIKQRFPRIYATCLKYDVDITKDLVPVSPAAHYMIGGVKTDLGGATTVPGLYAAGEVACTGVHGANRLASNSLLEGLVYGYRAGAAAAQYGRGVRRSGATRAFGKRESAPAAQAPTGAELEELRAALRRVMWEKVGIIRCGESLGSALELLGQWRGILDQEFSSRAGLEVKNMITVGTLLAEAAMARRGSVGAHYRSDSPDRGRDWQRHLTLTRTRGRTASAVSALS